jgi:Domain of unknown function (DUF4124)
MLMRPPLPLFTVLLVLACSTVVAAPSTPKSSQKGIAYRWVDEDGVVHYGDNVPPQYADKDRALLNGQGMEVGHIEGERTPEQVKAEQATRAAAQAQKQHDHFLISTYTSVKDIEALRDERLEQMKVQRVAAEQYVESLQARLATLQARAETYAPYSSSPGARRMPDDLAENLVRTVNELRAQNAAASAKSAEEGQLRAQFQADIERYRELHAVHSSN